MRNWAGDGVALQPLFSGRAQPVEAPSAPSYGQALRSLATMTPVSVLIVGDSVTMRAMLEQIILAAAGYQVVGIAADADAALALMTKCRPTL